MKTEKLNEILKLVEYKVTMDSSGKSWITASVESAFDYLSAEIEEAKVEKVVEALICQGLKGGRGSWSRRGLYWRAPHGVVHFLDCGIAKNGGLRPPSSFLTCQTE